MSAGRAFTPRLVSALTVLRRLLLLPLLAPLLAVLLLAALNPKPLVSVRLLTGRSPALPLGVWLAAGGAGGALLSAVTTAWALRDGRRRSRAGGPERRRQGSESWSAMPWSAERGGAATEAERSRRPEPEQDGWPQTGPQRGPGEPPPTVSVPFRVLRRPQRSAAGAAGPSGATPTAVAANRATTQIDRDAAAADDWDGVADEDW